MYYMGIQNPDSLSDDEWAMRVNELKYLRKTDAENSGFKLSR